jgi:hypothetical protein
MIQFGNLPVGLWRRNGTSTWLGGKNLEIGLIRRGGGNLPVGLWRRNWVNLPVGLWRRNGLMCKSAAAEEIEIN